MLSSAARSRARGIAARSARRRATSPDGARERWLAFRHRCTAVQRFPGSPDVVDKISTPLLTTDPEQDEFFSGQPQELFDALTCKKRLVPVTGELGGAGHCEPLARGQVSLAMNDWFAEHLAGN
jgi:hypothetical protein